MNITKKTISTKISKEIQLDKDISMALSDNFFNLIKTESKKKSVKLSKFGTFFYKQTVERVGRNPKTLEEYKIPSVKKLNFRFSSKAKKLFS